MTFKFESLELLVPELWDKPWAQWISDSDGIDREFAMAESVYAHMLRSVSAKPVTPEKVAWLTIWSRFFNTIAGVRGARDAQSNMSILALARVAYEVSLHVEAIGLPALTAAGSGLTEEAWERVRDRLRAYCAWTLRGDERLHERLAKPWHLHAAHDRQEEREFIRDLGDSVATWEAMSGQKLELVSKQEEAQDRRRAQAQFQSELKRIRTWLSDDRLRPWRDKLDQLEKVERGTVSFFQLVGAGTSVSDFLRQRGMSVGYFEYLRGSAVVHGSSMGSVMAAREGFLTPDFADVEDDAKRSAGHVISRCRIIAVLLQIIASHLDLTET